jgi:hypothetical protein
MADEWMEDVECFSQFSFEGAVEDGVEQGVQFGGGPGLLRASGWASRWPLELSPGELGFALALNFQVIQEFQEHDPSEHRQAVEVAIQPLVLAHDVARGFQECAEDCAVVGVEIVFIRFNRP